MVTAIRIWVYRIGGELKMFRVKSVKIVLYLSMLLLWIYVSSVLAIDGAHIVPQRVISENDVYIYSPWYFYDRLYTWSDIESYTGDYGLSDLKSIINFYVSPYDSVYLYGLSMTFLAWGMGTTPLSIEILSLIYEEEEDLVLAFNESWGTWEVIDRDSLGAYISSTFPLTIVVEDNSCYDGRPLWWEIKFTVVIAKVYTYGGGGGCEVGGGGSLSWLILLTPVVLLRFKMLKAK